MTRVFVHPIRTWHDGDPPEPEPAMPFGLWRWAKPDIRLGMRSMFHHQQILFNVPQQARCFTIDSDWMRHVAEQYGYDPSQFPPCEQAPNWHHSCGWYGVTDVDMLLRSHDYDNQDGWLLLQVELGGQVVEAERGFRGEWQVVTGVWVNSASTSQRTVERVAKAEECLTPHGVPYEVLDW